MRKSESIENIAKALVKFQAEVKNPPNTAVNPFLKNKYAPLNDILNLVRPILSKHGLGVIQAPSGDGESISIATMLMHESGEWIEPEPLVLKAEKATAQGAGAAITYGRRYALSAVLGISSEDDDDGSQTPQRSGKDRPKQQSQKHPKAEGPPNAATDSQIKAIFAISKALGVTSEDELKAWISSTVKRNIESMKHISKAEASVIITELNKMKAQSDVLNA